jgi:hypothetical protein
MDMYLSVMPGNNTALATVSPWKWSW